jgi:hypothetical protein
VLAVAALAMAGCGSTSPGQASGGQASQPSSSAQIPGDANYFQVDNTKVAAWCVNVSSKDQFGNPYYGVAAHVVNLGQQYSAQVNFIQTALYDASGTKVGDASGLAPWANGGAVAVAPGQDSYFTEGGSTAGQAFSSCRVDDISQNISP